MARRKKGELTKCCTKCGKEKPSTAEYFPNKYKDHKVVGLQAHCKECKSAYMKEYWARNKDKWKRYNKEWAEKNPERHRKIERRSRLKCRYGITDNEYQEMYDDQEGKCKICGKKISHEKLCIDHDHETERVRGLLCYSCNNFVGHVELNGHLLPLIFEHIE